VGPLLYYKGLATSDIYFFGIGPGTSMRYQVARRGALAPQPMV